MNWNLLSPELQERACARGIQDAAPPGLSGQPDHNSTIRASPNTVLLRVSETPWFNLPFACMYTDESGTRQTRLRPPDHAWKIDEIRRDPTARTRVER